MTQNRTLYISTDGGCRGNGSPNCEASYGYCIIDSIDIPSLDYIRRQAADITSQKKGRKPTAELDRILALPIDCYEGSGLIAKDKFIATNNRGELTALKEALQRVKDEDILIDEQIVEIVWISDSQYSQKSIDIWVRNWLKNPKKCNIETKLNLDLIVPLKDAIDDLRKKRIVKLVHIRSHKTAPVDTMSTDWFYWFLNDRVDKHCQNALTI